MRRFVLLTVPLGLVAALGASGCAPEIVPEPYVPTDEHDAYRYALEQAALLETALGRDWLRAAERAIRSPIEVEAPFRESFYIDRAEAFAAGYRFSVARGQRTEIQLELTPAADFRLFIDLFRAPGSANDGEGPVHVASGGEGDLRLAFEPRRDGEYILRVQSELLRGGACTVEIRNVASLDFPVAGRDTGAIGSVFGAERDAGRRRHHGVDIFAPRHTEVLATSRARVRRVDDWKLGGLVIWLEDPERDLRLYFAHLQTQEVREGAWVEPGDRIGTVGNSGNARTTAPHLHFGVYVRGEGPIDPVPFLKEPTREPREVRVQLEPLGGWVRTRKSRTPLRTSYDGDEGFRELPQGTPLRVLAGVSESYRVELPNGIAGYIAAGETEPLVESLSDRSIRDARFIRDEPSSEAAVVRLVEPGQTLDVLARFEAFELVATRGPRAEWVEVEVMAEADAHAHADADARRTAP